MSKYEITRSCGHPETVEVFGTNVHGERDRKLAWLASKPCAECRKAAEMAEVESFERKSGLSPEMAGSEKQVAWARKIRRQRFQQASEDGADDGFLRAFAEFANSKDAAFWIDGRDASFVDFLADNLNDIVIETVGDFDRFEVCLNKAKGRYYIVTKPYGMYYWFHGRDNAIAKAREMAAAEANGDYSIEESLKAYSYND